MNRIQFTLTCHPQNLAIKNVILKNFKILRNDPETKHMFSLPPLISFKRDKNLGSFLVRSAFKLNDQTGTFTCNRTRCKTGETGRRLADRFREHLRDAEQNNTDAFKPVARHFLKWRLGIKILPITPTTTWLFAGYPYSTGTQKAAKSRTKIHFSTGYTLSTRN